MGYRFYRTRSSRPDSNGTAEAYFSMMGAEFVLEIEWTLTTYGAPTTWDEEGYDPEFEINSIVMREDRYSDLGPAFVPTGKLLHLIEDSTHVYDQVIESINATVGYDDGDY